MTTTIAQSDSLKLDALLETVDKMTSTALGGVALKRTAEALTYAIGAMLPDGVRYDPAVGEIYHEGAPGQCTVSYADPDALAKVAVCAIWTPALELLSDGCTLADYLALRARVSGQPS